MCSSADNAILIRQFNVGFPDDTTPHESYKFARGTARPIVFALHVEDLTTENLRKLIDDIIDERTFVRSVFCPQQKSIHSISVQIDTPTVCLQGLEINEIVMSAISESHLSPGVRDAETKITMQWSKQTEPDLCHLYRLVFVIARR